MQNLNEDFNYEKTNKNLHVKELSCLLASFM